MKILIGILRVLTICILISSCATGYSRKGIKGGYSETRLGEDTYSVRFQGNGYTSADKAGDYCLLRCAEIAKENGYNYFKLIRGEERVTKDFDSEKQRNHNTIKLYKEKPVGEEIYEASFVIKSIKEKYKVK